jgi:outer membrane protein OmpA-like peptidoglycan-associated protein
MRRGTFFLAGALAPLLLSCPTLSAERPGVIVLAQGEQECTPGTEGCPAAPEEEAPPAEQPQQQDAAPEQPAEQPQEQQAAPEEPAEQLQEQQAAPEEPAEQLQEQQAAPEEPVEEQQQQQAAPEEPVEPLQEQQAAPEEPVEEQQQQQAAPEEPVEPLQEQQAAPEETADQPQEQQAQPTIGACPPGTDCPPAEEAAAPQPAAEVDTTVEQQLEAQGDREEANRVRSLRDRLLDQLQEAIVPTPGQQPRADANRRQGRDGDRRRRVYDRDEEHGEVMERRGGGVIIRLDNGDIYVEPDVPDEGGRLLYGADDVNVEQLRGGFTRTTVYRSNGVQIVTVRDRYGEIVRRSKRLPDGREIGLIDNQFGDGNRRRPQIVRVAPPRVNIPHDQYIVDLGHASRQDIRRTLLAPPVDTMERRYTLDEVLRNQEIRAYSPRIDLDTITFEFGSATIGVDQMPTLLALGEVMEEIIYDNPDEMYLIEGHTDLVGTDYDNLLLSYRRAEAVAVALSQNFDIPPENLITEGYGEQYPKVLTEGPERINRRAAVLRLTDIVAQN